MNQQEFESKRAELIKEAEALTTAEEIIAKTEEIEALDKAFDEELKAQAAKERVKSMTNPFKLNEQKNLNEIKSISYDEVFAKFVKGEDLSADERDCFAKNNFKNATTTTSGHTAVIPQTLAKEILTEIGETHAVLKDIATFNVKGFLSIPKGSMTANVGWYDEGDNADDAAVSTSKIDLSAYDLRCNMPVSFRMKEMSTSEFLNFIKTKIVEQAGDKLANAVINGLGIPGISDNFKAQPTGIVTALEAETDTQRILTYTNSTTSEVLETKIREMLGKIKTGYKGKKFYAKNTVIWNVIAGIKDNDGRHLFIADATGDFAGRIFGVPVVEEDAIPNDAILLGDFKKGYVVNFNKDLTLMQQDRNKDAETDYTLYGLVDGKPTMTEAFVYLKKS